MITDQKSLEESAVEGIENPVVVTPPLQDERMSRNEDSCSSWFRKIQSSHTVSTQKAIRVLAALCALGLLGGVTISVWFIVKLLLKPTSNSTTALEHAKETSFCNISDDSSVADPRKVFYRISAENSLLEIQLDKLQTWLPVCYKRWNSSLGTLVCRQLGHLRWEKLTARSHTLLAISSIHLSGSWASYLWARHRITDKYTHKIYFTFKTGTAAAKELVWVREDESASRLTKYKGVNLTDIEHSYTDGFVQITAEHQSKLESVWQFRGNCSIGKIIALKCFDCGTRAKVPRIIGGVDATLGRWPWQVSLYYNNRHTCGGSIITSQWIITAAHCVATYRLHQASSWVVYAGIVTRNAAKLAQYVGYTVEKIIYNKNYNHRSHDSDIALMKLRNPLNFSDTIRPVCLPQHDHELPAGTLCWISGWGYTQPDEGHIPDTLKEAQVTLISTKKCNSSCMYHGEITARMLCAGHTEGNTDACQGDSGGPLVCQDDHAWRLVGVVSWGTGCAQPNHPGVYTKVAEFLGWIYEILETS